MRGWRHGGSFEVPSSLRVTCGKTVDTKPSIQEKPRVPLDAYLWRRQGKRAFHNIYFYILLGCSENNDK